MNQTIITLYKAQTRNNRTEYSFVIGSENIDRKRFRRLEKSVAVLLSDIEIKNLQFSQADAKKRKDKGYFNYHISLLLNL